jgi:hypothetical protein
MHAEHYLLRIRIPNLGLSTSVHWEGGNRRGGGGRGRWGGFHARREHHPAQQQQQQQQQGRTAETSEDSVDESGPADQQQQPPGCGGFFGQKRMFGQGRDGEELKAHLASLDTNTLKAKESHVKERLSAVQAKHAALRMLIDEREEGEGEEVSTPPTATVVAEPNVSLLQATSRPYDPFMTLEEYLGRAPLPTAVSAAPATPAAPAPPYETMPAKLQVHFAEKNGSNSVPEVVASMPAPTEGSGRYSAERAELEAMGLVMTPELEGLLEECGGDLQALIAALYL